MVKDTDDLQLSVQTYQNVFNDKIKELEDSIKKIKENHKKEIIQLKNENEDSKDKLRILEDRSFQTRQPTFCWHSRTER